MRRSTLSALVAGACLVACAALSAGAGAVSGADIITTVAGSGDPNAGTDGQATSVGFKPRAIAVDTAGNLYIAAAYNSRVFKVTPGSVLTQLAGVGTPGFTGDNELAGPGGVAVDGAGNVFIADTGNHRVVKLAADGVITSVAGTATPGSSGDGGPARAAQLNRPGDLAVDGAGNLFIVETANGRVRKVTPDGPITTVPGVTAHHIAVDNAGNLYFVGNNRVSKMTPAGVVTPVAGTGSRGFAGDNDRATDALLAEPSGVAVDGAGNVYIADLGNLRVRRVGLDGVITTVVGTGIEGSTGDNGPASSARLQYPVDVAVDGDGNLYVADEISNRIRKVTVTAAPPTAPTPPTGSQTADTAVEADVIGASAGKSRLGRRVVRLELSLQESISATLTLVRSGATLATKQFAVVREGERVLVIAVPAGTAKGRATLRFELADQEGNTFSGRRGVRIGKP